ncbi:hypothetical protein HYV85_01685 [Candidatus Woesearchaeota archaeon]|nr:hypothetical protein [Candidatus Woesearchaeota archaeon]
MTSEPERPEQRPEQRLEQTVQDAYIVSLKRKEEGSDVPPLSVKEKQQQFETLVQMVEQLQQQYGVEKLTLTRKFEYVPTPAIAAIIKDNEILEILLKEGYSVEQQGRMRTSLKPDA